MTYMYAWMIVVNYLLSGTLRSTLDYILIDRSNRDLLNDDKISREKSGPVSQVWNNDNNIMYYKVFKW